MSRPIFLAPLALVTSACAMRPFTPAASVSYGGEAVPGDAPYAVPANDALVSRWQPPPQGPWAPFHKTTLLAALDASNGVVEMPDVMRLDLVDRATRAGARLAAAGVRSDTMWLVDLRGAASVAFGSALTRGAPATATLVLTFNNWPSDDEMVPAEETLAALLALRPGPSPPPGLASAPVFLLDAWRLAYRNERPDDGVIDNRYMLTPVDFPEPSYLLAHGVHRVMYVVENLDEAAFEEDDLHVTLAAYQAAGIELHMVDLSWIERAETLPAWPVVMAGYPLVVDPRYTLVENPAFYERAHGGFGGVVVGGTRFGPRPGGGAGVYGGHAGVYGGHGGG